MKQLRRSFVTLLIVCATPLAAQQPQGSAATPVSPFDVSNRDTTCAACGDFYQFANGGWIKRATIPAAYPMWGTLIELQDRTEQQVRAVVDEAAKGVGGAKRGSDAWKIGTLYNACMDSVAIEQRGAAPLRPALDVIAAITGPADLPRALVRLEEVIGIVPFSAGQQTDFRNSTVYVTNFGQGGLGLPNRDFYFRTDPQGEALRKAYVDHIRKMLELAGDTPEQAARMADRVMAFELRLAHASLSPVQMRNPGALYNRMTLDSLDRLAPRLQLKLFVSAQGVRVQEVVVNHPPFYRTLDSMVTDVPAAEWRAYLRFRAANVSANALSSAFVNQAFAFRSQFTGQRELLPRHRRCLATVQSVLGEAVGREYVKRYFSPEAKAAALALIDNLQAVLRERIATLEWMSDSTRTQALAKLAAMRRKIGYPDKWRDYSKLEVRPGEYFDNLQGARRWSNARNWERANKPVDKDIWFVNPQTVDAFYNAVNNEIVFPAGVLQAPAFDPKADLAVNYGAIGAVIGHELTHGFDDTGRQFDASGNLRDWWTAKDDSSYKARAQRVVDQFNAYTILDSTTHVNGRLTLGENISDLGGLTIAYHALQKALAREGRPGLIEGFTPEQRFFLAFATAWRRIARPQFVRQMLNVDSHAPWELRANGPMSNMPEFRAAWGCKEGDRMVRADSVRAKIW